MANTLGVYNPQFFAQEALIQLEAVMGLANRVYMGFDEERRSFGLGEYINIRRPSNFTALDAPSAAQDMATETVQVQLNQWKEVKFALTDKELAFTGERIVRDHIRPAAVALADKIDTTIAALYNTIPWQYDVGSTPGIIDITTPRQMLFDNKVPLRDPSMMHYMMDGSLENAFLQLTAFSQNQGAADRGVSTQLNGNIGQKFGFNLWANQNTPSFTAGTGTITAAAVNNGAGYPVGTTSIAQDATTQTTGTVVAGDTFKFAGHSQNYVVTNTPTYSTNATSALQFSPPLKVAVADNEGITFTRVTGKQGMAFHRNAFCLVTAPLSTLGDGRGADIASVTDPITGLSLRSRIYYDGDNSKVLVALDVLFGVKTLDQNMAVRVVI